MRGSSVDGRRFPASGNRPSASSQRSPRLPPRIRCSRCGRRCCAESAGSVRRAPGPHRTKERDEPGIGRVEIKSLVRDDRPVRQGCLRDARRSIATTLGVPGACAPRAIPSARATATTRSRPRADTRTRCWDRTAAWAARARRGSLLRDPALGTRSATQSKFINVRSQAHWRRLYGIMKFRANPAPNVV